MNVIVYVFSCILVVVATSDCPIELDQSPEDINCRNEKPQSRFHCQIDPKTSEKITFCIPPVQCNKGEYAAISISGVTCKACKPPMFQHTGKWSYEFDEPNCDKPWSGCDSERKVKCGDPDATHDTKCRCDYTKDYKPSNQGCDCFPNFPTLGCDCVRSDCGNGTTLDKNFQCVPVIVPVTLETTTPSPTDSGQTDSGLSGGWIAFICIALVVAVLVILGVVGYKCWLRRRSNSRDRGRGVEGDPGERESDVLMADRNIKSQQNVPGPSDTNAQQNVPGSSNANGTAVNSSDEIIYQKSKPLFVESVNPKMLLVYLNLPSNEEEKASEVTDNKGRHDGALHLLRTVRRVHPNDWLDHITEAMEKPEIGLKEQAKKIKDIKLAEIKDIKLAESVIQEDDEATGMAQEGQDMISETQDEAQAEVYRNDGMPRGVQPQEDAEEEYTHAKLLVRVPDDLVETQNMPRAPTAPEEMLLLKPGVET